MMQNERVIRTVAFVVFFSVGAAVLSATTLCDDLLEYYYYKGLLAQAESHLKKLESLNTDYDILLAQLEGNPKELARLAPATLGIEVNEPNTAYPRATAGKLAREARLSRRTKPNYNHTGRPAVALPFLSVASQAHPVYIRRDFGADFLCFLRPD